MADKQRKKNKYMCNIKTDRIINGYEEFVSNMY